MKKELREKAIYGVVTVVLVLLSAFCISSTVFSREDVERAELEGYYSALEKQAVADVRTFLNEEGFVNSGVMLTRVVDAEGNRDYTLTVHHDSINRMEVAEQEELGEALALLCFEDEYSSFVYKFLE